MVTDTSVVVLNIVGYEVGEMVLGAEVADGAVVGFVSLGIALGTVNGCLDGAREGLTIGLLERGAFDNQSDGETVG